MRVLILADPNSTHTYKWICSLSSCGIHLFLFGLEAPQKEIYKNIKNLTVYVPGFLSKHIEKEKTFSKMYYLRALPELKRKIRTFRPDIIHSHYASSYGLLGALSHFKPLIISVWGSDIYNFPKQNYFFKAILKYNLNKADVVLSTSEAMAKETMLYTDKKIIVMPFGIDTSVFKPFKTAKLFDEDNLIIGTVKTLEKNYGIEILIKAFYQVYVKYPDKKMKLLLVGGGDDMDYFINIVRSLGIEHEVLFTGQVDYHEVPKYHNMLDIYVAVSVGIESFGVAVLEASACGKPVIVSNIGGLPEVVVNERTGLIIQKDSIPDTTAALEELILSESLRKEMGIKGRQWVEEKFTWKRSIAQMIGIYNDIYIH